jgi:CheY-like chemotaxis protein
MTESEGASLGRLLRTAEEWQATLIDAIEQSGRHVLLAEDNEVNRTIVLAWLDRLGCSADCAKNGREALALLHTKQFDLILMDCQMPEMDGFAATAEIRRRSAQSRAAIEAEWERIGRHLRQMPASS